MSYIFYLACLMTYLDIAVDIEKKGAGLQHAINAGVAYRGNDGKMVKRTFCFEDAESKFEKCYDEFWSKNMTLLERIDAASEPASIGWGRFVSLIDSLESPDRALRSSATIRRTS